METTPVRTERKIVATTHVDRHRERMSRSALEALATQLRARYIPLGYEHDPRYPPLGRMVGAQVVELPDGEFAAEALLEFWDADPTTLTIESDGREIPRLVESDSPSVQYDRTFRDSASHEIVAEIGALLESRPVMVAKKAVDPIPVLTLVLGTFVAGGIAQGFFGRLGEDAYNALKGKLVRLYEHRKRPGLIQIVVATTLADEHDVEWIVVAESRRGPDVEHLLEQVLAALDRDAAKIAATVARLRAPRRIVFAWRKRRLELLHILDTHGVPIVVAEIPKMRSWRRQQGRAQRSEGSHWTPGEHRRCLRNLAGLRCGPPRGWRSSIPLRPWREH